MQLVRCHDKTSCYIDDSQSTAGVTLAGLINGIPGATLSIQITYLTISAFVGLNP
jgi:hypothetical protein